MNQRDLTLLTDFYELTMMQGYYEKGQNETVIFDVFYRQNPCNGGYAICAGLEQVIEYVKGLNFTYVDSTSVVTSMRSRKEASFSQRNHYLKLSLRSWKLSL